MTKMTSWTWGAGKLVTVGLLLFWLSLSCYYQIRGDRPEIHRRDLEKHESQMVKWARAFQSGKFVDNDDIAKKVK